MIKDIGPPIAQAILASINNTEYKTPVNYIGCNIPRHLLTTDDAEILKNVVLHSVATALASMVYNINKTIAYYKITNYQKSIERSIICANPYKSEIIILHKSQ